MIRSSALVRLGFADAAAAVATVERLGAEELIAFFGRVGDPDLALRALSDLAEASADDLIEELVNDEGTAMRLLSVLGASRSLGEHLVKHPTQWRVLTDGRLGSTRPTAAALRAELLTAVGADPGADVPVASVANPEDALRVAYRRLLVPLAARDLAHALALEDTAAELSDLACATVEAAVAIARTKVDVGSLRFAVIALGKTGGHELNYVSDVDVVFVHAAGPDQDFDQAADLAGKLAAEVIEACSAHTSEGTIWPLDAALRPEGKAGALSRTLDGHVGYYERWASAWEFQALLKARPAAGDRALGEAYVAALAPMVWKVAERADFVAETQAMRRRVVSLLPTKDAGRNLKLGVGGLRDVEFAVQLLQLVHGRTDDRIRSSTTLVALDALTRAGYVGREDGEELHRAYTFLRQTEHRLQLFDLRRTHLVPREEEAQRRLARTLGMLREPVETFTREWAKVKVEVRRLHEKLFYRPLLNAVASLPADGSPLTPEAALDRLEALGFSDPGAAVRHLQAMTSGVSRSAAIQRALLPVMLDWFASGANPDAGLFGFRRVSESLGSTHWYLRALRDEGEIAERLARILSTSPYTTALLEVEPEGVRMLGTELSAAPADALTVEMLASAQRQQTSEAAVRAVRAIRRRELFRGSAAEVLGLSEIDATGERLSRITDATLEASLRATARSVQAEMGSTIPPAQLAIIAMGRYGGFELGYASDADVMFVYRAVEQPVMAQQYAERVFGELGRLLALPGRDPVLDLDASLRPEGRQGPLVRSLEAYARYYERDAEIWERQALLRADAVVGDGELRDDFTAMIDTVRYGPAITPADAREIRRIKGRVDAERLPRGADRNLHVKLGRGGLADIEWTVQLLQLQHSHDVAGLRTPRTMPALDAARSAGVIDPDDAEILATGWRHVSRVRNAMTLARGRAANSLPTNPIERRTTAAILGYGPGESERMLDDYLRITRQTRAVVDRIFWE